jgi:hypothetical protein
MFTLVAFLPLVFSFVLFALLAKFAARLYRSSKLSWKHALVYGLLVMFIGGAGAFVNILGGTVLGLLLGLFLGLTLQLALGGWYLGSRAFLPSGESLGFKAGALIAAMTFGIIFAIGVFAALIVPLLAGLLGKT